MNCPRCKVFVENQAHFCPNCGIDLSIYKHPEKVQKKQDVIIMIVFGIFIVTSIINVFILQKTHDFYAAQNTDYFILFEIIKSIILIPLALSIKNKPWKITALIITLINIISTVHWCLVVF